MPRNSFSHYSVNVILVRVDRGYIVRLVDCMGGLITALYGPEKQLRSTLHPYTEPFPTKREAAAAACKALAAHFDGMDEDV